MATTGGKSMIESGCCEFSVGELPESVGYCYICKQYHSHRHLDLRELRLELVARVEACHEINWDELSFDEEKVRSVSDGAYCESLLFDLTALCRHGNVIRWRELPVGLFTCYQQKSLSRGLDFTVDICDRTALSQGQVRHRISTDAIRRFEEATAMRHPGEILRYSPSDVAFYSA